MSIQTRSGKQSVLRNPVFALLVLSVFVLPLSVQFITRVSAQASLFPITAPVTPPVTPPNPSITVTPTPTVMPTGTPKPTTTPTPWLTPTPTPKVSPTGTPKPTPTVMPTGTPKPTTTPTPRLTPTPTPRLTPTPTPRLNRPPVINTNALPTGKVRSLYLARIMVTDADVKDTVFVSGQNIPKGLSLAYCSQMYAQHATVAYCYIFGVPTARGTYQVTITATDKAKASSQKTLQLTIK